MEEIFDPIRKIQVKNTPEEVVRQQVIQWLLTTKKAPDHAIDIEVSLNRFEPTSNDRLDILVTRFNSESSKPVYELLVECKRPEVALDQDIMLQVQKYLAIIPAQFVMVTNGKVAKFLQRGDNGYTGVSNIPDY